MVVIEIVNDGTGDEIEAHYDVTIKVNTQIIHQFRIESHNRLSGIPGLVRCLAKGFKRNVDSM